MGAIPCGCNSMSAENNLKKGEFCMHLLSRPRTCTQLDHVFAFTLCLHRSLYCDCLRKLYIIFIDKHQEIIFLHLFRMLVLLHLTKKKYSFIPY